MSNFLTKHLSVEELLSSPVKVTVNDHFQPSGKSWSYLLGRNFFGSSSIVLGKTIVLTCFLHLHLLDQLAVLRFPQVTLQIESTADSRVGDNGHEDLGAIDLLPLPPASLSLSLSHSVSHLHCLSMWVEVDSSEAENG